VALSAVRLHAYRAVVQFHQPAGDRQPQAYPAEATRSRPLRLPELVEDGGLLVMRDPQAGVADRQGDRGCICLGAQRDLTAGCELDRVADQV
jgi:hypothetical protein